MTLRGEENLLITLLFSDLWAKIKERVQRNEFAILSLQMKLATWAGGVRVQLGGAGLG